MNSILSILLLLLSFSLFAGDSEIKSFHGKVKIIQNGAEIPLEVGRKIPDDCEIITESGSQLEILTSKGLYKIKENNTIKIEKLLSLERMINPTVTHVTGVRSLYESIQVQMNKESKLIFDAYVKNAGGKIEDHKGWKVPVESAFTKMMKASGKEAFNLEYAVVANDSFNAAALPGGQFFIHTKTLDLLDEKIDAYRKEKSIPDSKKSEYRENYIAAILSHELSHYYNQHSLKTQMKIVGNPTEDDIIEASKYLEQIDYSQDLELEADLSGFLLLKKSGYDPNWMVAILEILKNLHAENVKGRNRNIIPYFQSHPSPNERLSLISGDKQEFYRMLAKLEHVFADIQLGANLKNCIKEIDSALEIYKNNVELLKAKSIAEHKYWLTTVPTENQVLRSLLDMPAFRDEMIPDESNTKKGEKMIPGDLEAYYAAVESYRKVFEEAESIDPAFLSNYAALLVYSTEESEIKKAISMAENSFNSQRSIQTANNLGVVYWIGEEKTKALEIFGNLAPMINTNLKTAIVFSSIDDSIKANWANMKKEIAIRNSFDPNYVSDLFTPVLNYSLVQYYNGDKKSGKEIADVYLNYYDSDSNWAVYLAKTAKIKLNISAKSFAINGVTVGNSEKELFKKLGTPSGKEIEEIKIGDNSKKIIRYSKPGMAVSIFNGKISMIRIQKGSSAKLNDSISVGDPVSKIEKTLGKPGVQSKSSLLYRGKQKLKILINQNKIKELIVY